jgi:uncharacterized membrane protein YeaQ/YmgE (transglycosylase-associated protein family)
MKHSFRNFLLPVILLISFSAAAFADTVQGRVAAVSSVALDMTVYDAQGNPYPNTLHIKVDSRTQLIGFSSVVSLRKQDAISTEVKQLTSAWYAVSIARLQGAGSVQRSTTPPSPSLLSTLNGQKIIRNGLLGAVTGAVAAKASGGKAGKGALVGAGAGIVGGLLADMFSSRPQAQSSLARVSSEEDARR